MIDGKACLVALYTDTEDRLNTIYIGKVKNIVKNIDAAFVELTPGFTAYLNLRECRDLVVLNRNRTECDLRQGDEIPVQLIKSAVKSKKPICTGRLRLNDAKKEEILNKARTRTVYSVLAEGTPEYVSFLNKIDLSEVARIVTDDITVFEAVSAYCSSKNIGISPTLYEDDYPLTSLYKITSVMDELKSKTVWLKSGANIVIEHTEAMNVIDVNTAKSINDKSDNHILKVNLEAADEIMRQLRLRNLSGMILIDFINDSAENMEIVTDRVKELARLDDIKTDYIDITGLGIMELTRAKKGHPLHELI